MTVFADIVRKSAVIRVAYIFYNNAPRFIKYYLLIIYGLKCYLSANCSGSVNSDILFFACNPNEKVAIAHIRRHLPGLTASDLSLSKSNCFRMEALKALPRFIRHGPRLYRIARQLARRHHFLPACRIFSTVTYYLSYRRLLEAWRPRAIFIANHYAPESVALAAAAHRMGCRVFCANHGNGISRSGVAPLSHFDLVAVTSAAILAVYTAHSQGKLNSIFIPPASPRRPMQYRVDLGRPITIGIFLTALTNVTRLQSLVRDLAGNPMVGRVLIRCHPVKVVSEDLTGIVAQDGDVVESSRLPLFENIKHCDIAICGNSSVAIDVLRGGVPVLYDAALDELPYDSNGYQRGNLMLPLPAEIDSALLQSVERFYGDPSWADRIQYFDASYQQDEEAMFQDLRDAVRRIIRGAEVVEAVTAPRDAPANAPEPAIAS